MKVMNINIENKTFQTNLGETYPLMFDADKNITLDELQALIYKSEKIIEELKN